MNVSNLNYKATCGELEAEVTTEVDLEDILALFRSLSLDAIHVYKRENRKDDWKHVREIGKCMSVESK